MHTKKENHIWTLAQPKAAISVSKADQLHGSDQNSTNITKSKNV